MKIGLWVIGKTSEKYLQDGINIFIKRLLHYCNFEYKEHHFKLPTTLNQQDLKRKEAEHLLSQIKENDLIVLLDEKGKKYSSEKFSEYLEHLQNTVNSGRVIFIVGGAFGFDESIYKRSNHSISLSDMTFSHQMIRLFFTEQLYRGFTIIKGEKYHNP